MEAFFITILINKKVDKSVYRENIGYLGNCIIKWMGSTNSSKYLKKRVSAKSVWAAVTKYHKRGGVGACKQQKCISQSWRLEV